MKVTEHCRGTEATCDIGLRIIQVRNYTQAVCKPSYKNLLNCLRLGKDWSDDQDATSAVALDREDVRAITLRNNSI